MTEKKGLTALAKNIIKDNQYMTVGTTCENGDSWVAPVAYSYDEQFNLYFISQTSARHIHNTINNPNAAVAVFDSHIPYGSGVGLQMMGRCTSVGRNALLHAINCYVGRKWPFGKAWNLKQLKMFMKNHNYGFYKFKPEKVWVTDPDVEYDARVEVRL